MRAPLPLQSELSAMRDQLAQESAHRRVHHAHGHDTFDPWRILDDLQQLVPDDWREISDKAQDAVQTHPVASMASAFLVGLVVGRLSGRGQ